VFAPLTGIMLIVVKLGLYFQRQYELSQKRELWRWDQGQWNSIGLVGYNWELDPI